MKGSSSDVLLGHYPCVFLKETEKNHKSISQWWLFQQRLEPSSLRICQEIYHFSPLAPNKAVGALLN
jgi:hypothetical protein